MKFTYWSGNKKELETELRGRENYIEAFAKRLGLDTENIKVMFNYKDQTNKSKIIRMNGLDKEDTIDRASVMEHKNGVLAIRMNDRVISKRIISKLSSVPQLFEQQFEVAADIECDILMSYIAYTGVVKSNAYKDLEKSLEDEPFEPLVPLFIASYIKTKENLKNIKIVGDPYLYENVSMTENDWMDLFDICNYHRVASGKNFSDAVRDRYPNRINSKLNRIIETLEAYLNTYIENGGTI